MSAFAKRFAVAIGLAMLALALSLPGLRALPVTDRDEARYAQASKQMVESGDYLNIRFLREARNKKPAGIYWLQAAAVRAVGVKDVIWPYRAVSALAALAAVLFTWALARRLHPASPFQPAAALAAAPLTIIVAHAATTDAALLATVVAAQACLAAVYLRGETRVPVGAAIGFWVALGAGILIKGPLTPLVTGLTILALVLLDRRGAWLRDLKPFWGVPLMLLIVLPWLIAIQHATHGAFLREAWGHDFGAKVQGGQEAHGAPPGAYLVVTTLLFWPLVPLAWRGLGQAWRERRTDPGARFLLAWLVPAWLVFECVPTKLPHYVLPLYPALAVLAVRAADHGATGGPPFHRLWRWSCGLIDAAWWVAAAAWVALPPLVAWLLGTSALPAAYACAGVAAIAAIVMRAARRRVFQRHRIVACAAGFAVLYFGLLFGTVLPRLEEIWLTRRIADMIAAQERATGRPLHVMALGYEEPSLPFTLGTQTRLGGGLANVVRALAAEPDAAVLVQDAPALPPDVKAVVPACGKSPWDRLHDTIIWGGCAGLSWSDRARERIQLALDAPAKARCRSSFLAEAEKAGVRVREVGAVEGLNYSKTWRVRVALFVKDDQS